MADSLGIRQRLVKKGESTTNGSDMNGSSPAANKNRKEKGISLTGLIFKAFKWTLVLVLLGVLFMFVIAPVCFRQSITIQRGLLFMNWLNLPLFRNLSHPEMEYNMSCTRNFYIPHPEGGSLGAWHVLPASRVHLCDLNTTEKISPGKEFADKRPIILYLHGNGGARGGNHRRELYKILAYNPLTDYHVIAIDYRGYGDSINVPPTAPNLISDARVAYDYLLGQLNVDKDRIIVWGHSLGTAVATYLVSSITPGHQPRGVVLEAPFTSLKDGVANHPLSQAFKKTHPYFEYYFVDPITSNPDLNFDSASKIRSVHAPLLILHAKDDMILPYELGHKLFQIAQETRPKSAPTPQMQTYSLTSGYGHKAIFKDAALPSLIRTFVDTSLSPPRQKDAPKKTVPPTKQKPSKP